MYDENMVCCPEWIKPNKEKPIKNNSGCNCNDSCNNSDSVFCEIHNGVVESIDNKYHRIINCAFNEPKN